MYKREPVWKGPPSPTNRRLEREEEVKKNETKRNKKPKKEWTLTHTYIHTLRQTDRHTHHWQRRRKRRNLFIYFFFKRKKEKKVARGNGFFLDGCGSSNCLDELVSRIPAAVGNTHTCYESSLSLNIAAFNVKKDSRDLTFAMD